MYSKDFKQKYFLFCRDCVLQIPQKTKKETEKRDKVINIIEIKK